MAQPASDLGSKWVTVPKKFKGIKSTSHPTTLKYVTALEEEMLRRADPHNSDIDKEKHYGPGGVESLNDSGLGDSAPGESEGTGYGGDPGGYSGYGGWGDYGEDNTGAQVGLSKGGWGSSIGGGPIGDPGDDPRASEGGGDWEIEEPRTGPGPGPGPGSGAGPVNGGTDTPEDDGPTEAELLAARIADAMGAISSLFAGRQGVYDRLRDSSYALSESGIADAYERAARRLRFQMLRQGLDTGQPDIDLRADLSKVKNDSLANAMRHAQGLSEALRQRDAAKRSSLMSQALSGNLMPGQVSGMAGTLSAGVPQSWGGIADIGWNIPTGYAPSGYGGFMPDWRSQDTGAYFGSLS